MKNKIVFVVISLLFFAVSNLLAQQKITANRVYIKIEVKGLACPYCAYGMEKELKKVSGVNEVEIELKKGLAYISTPVAQQPTKEALAKIIKDAGFTAGVIEFNKEPFVKASKSGKKNKTKHKF